jgi:DNA-binding transcriptional LysR family regulator
LVEHLATGHEGRGGSCASYQKQSLKWRFDDLVTFMSVVEAGSVTSAATRLNLSKSVVSKRISDLEAALRIELFHRSTGSVRPTELAHSYYEQIAPLVQGLVEATEGLCDGNDSLKGRLRIISPVSFGTNFLSPVIAEFAKLHPELEIAIDYEAQPVNLTQAGYDLGIRIGDLKDSSLKARKLWCAAAPNMRQILGFQKASLIWPITPASTTHGLAAPDNGSLRVRRTMDDQLLS